MNTHDIELPKPAVVAVSDDHTRWITVRNKDYFTRDQVLEAIEAALQSQNREYAERIQFMADEACAFSSWKQEDGSWKYRLEWDLGDEWQTQWFDSPEEAIDHARRAEGGGE